ncbi:MAG TPA: hypothetical protein VLJ76_00565 [Gaiellaceae bacterium]|nr:hypothetical protein [Gaiellaceae bacterium]
MSTDAQVVGQNSGPAPEKEEAAGLVQQVMTNFRTGNLGILPIALGFVAIVIFFSLTANNFFTANNFDNVIQQMAPTTMLAFGVVFVLLLGEIDLSIGYVAGMGMLIVASLQDPAGPALPGVVAMVLTVVCCATIGLIQGSIVAFVGVPSFVVTLAGLLIWQGVILKQLQDRGVITIQDTFINDTSNFFFSTSVGLIIAGVISFVYVGGTLAGVAASRRAGIAIRNPLLVGLKMIAVVGVAFGIVVISNRANIPHGLPLAGLLVISFLVIWTYVAKRTTFGRHVYAVGGSAEAARRAGINVPRIRVLVFVISAAMAGIGGIINAAYVNSVDLNAGGGTILLDAISAAVIGGTSLFGGRGEVRSAVVGALVIATISNGLLTAQYPQGTIYIVTGVILLLAVTLDTVARRLQVRSGR